MDTVQASNKEEVRCWGKGDDGGRRVDRRGKRAFI